MTLLRSTARTMLASYFVVSGLKAVRDPESLVPAAEPLVDGVVPTVQRFAPEQVAGLLPTDAKTWVRINGALELVGGIALASGKGRRLGAALLALSLVPTTIGKYPFWSRSDPAERAADRDHFLKNVSLLGGVLIASRDTEGKPSLGYRANKTSQALVADTKKVSHKVSKETKQLTDAALAEGALLVGAVVGTSRSSRRKGAKQLKAAQVAAGKHAAEVKQAAAKAAKQAQKDAGKLAKNAGNGAGKQLDAAKKGAGKQLDAAKKAAQSFAENIELGEN
ncbi:MAG TPA: DoxX family protein [Microlunatus sp.]